MQLHANVFGTGTPFLILHGFLGMGDNWKTLGKKFAEHNYEVHLLDQRNHGRSEHSTNFNYDVLAEDIREYCTTKNLKDIIILGHSMGGKTAMQFATLYPNIVSKLIVADISPRFYPIHHDSILNGLEALDFSKITSRNEADKALSNYVQQKGTRQFLLKNLYWEKKNQLALRLNLPVLKEHVSEVGEALPVHAKFEKYTLFLKGDKSEYISKSDNAIIKSHFPNAIIKTIENAGHWLHAENPKQFFEFVINFTQQP